MPPDLLKSALQLGAWNGDRDTFRWFTKRLDSSTREQERLDLLEALGAFRDDSLREELRKYILDRVPPRNRFVPLVAMCSNAAVIPSLWPWFTSHVSRLERLHPLHYERVVSAVVPFAGLGRENEVEKFLKQRMGKIGVPSSDVIGLSLERLRVNSRFRDESSSHSSAPRGT